jgi:hypothetical protein
MNEGGGGPLKVTTPFISFDDTYSHRAANVVKPKGVVEEQYPSS